MTPPDYALVLGLVAVAAGLGWLLGRAHGRRELATTLLRSAACMAAAQRARAAQDVAEHRDVLRGGPGLSAAERDVWDARELA